MPRWRLKSPASPLFTQPFIRVQIKENIKAPRHWPLCGEFTGTGEFPAQRASYAENVSIWWRHHVKTSEHHGMETLSALLTLCIDEGSTSHEWIPRTKGQQSRTLVSLFLACISFQTENWVASCTNILELYLFCLASSFYQCNLTLKVNALSHCDSFMLQLAPSHYLNQCWNIINLILKNKLRWNVNENSYIFVQENVFKNVICEMAAILSQPQSADYNSKKTVYIIMWLSCND